MQQNFGRREDLLKQSAQGLKEQNDALRSANDSLQAEERLVRNNISEVTKS